jgi:hypothetical protein
MNYSIEDFSRDLLIELDSQYSVEALSKWASKKYHELLPFKDEKLRMAVLTVMAMGEGPEFEMGEAETRGFAKSLLNVES